MDTQSVQGSSFAPFTSSTVASLTAATVTTFATSSMSTMASSSNTLMAGLHNSTAQGLSAVPIYAKPFPDISKIEVFNGQNFKRWKDHVFSLLDMHGVTSALVEAKTNTNAESWEYANKVCRHTILATLSDNLFDTYVSYKEAKMIWESMTVKYTAEDAVKQRFVCGKYYRWEMTDDKDVISQINEYHKLLEDLKTEGIKLQDEYVAELLIEKLPKSWNDYKQQLKHKEKKMNLSELIKHIIIEDTNRKELQAVKSKAMETKANLVQDYTNQKRGFLVEKMEKIRKASHAGSWYTDDAEKLAGDLDGWLRACGLAKSSDVRGVIAPHAGYSYSGRAAAYAFANIDPEKISRVFLLGPSHHYYTPKCALSKATIYRTPIRDLPIDQEVNEELKSTGKFELMDHRVDEAEHSMEMHLPYLAKVFQGYQVKIVPILVGALSGESEAMYGQILAKYVDDPNNFFSVSSDFCHWGSRFNYTHYDKTHGSLYKSIEALDRMGMDIIETGDPDAFKQYLLETDNTICGRHPISVFLHMLKNSSTKIKIKFLRYEQSSQCRSMRDSSVSYASAAAKLDDDA